MNAAVGTDAAFDYDMVIVGGGIHGVGVAQAAAVAGYACLVLEQTALAAGTSSKSSKLIHGGLRYLETGQIRLVRECLRERRILLRIAPELVSLCPMYFPVYSASKRPPWQVRLGLMLYAAFGGLSPNARFRSVPREEWSRLDGLETRSLRAVFQYFDAQTDDRRLTETVMRTATDHGASLEMPARFDSATLRDDGVDVCYTVSHQRRTVRARVLVNAAGPWVDRVVSRITPSLPTEPVEFVAGAHIVLASPAKSGVYYVESPADRRVVFIMPWRGQTMIGTTETPFTGDPATVSPLPEERQYLLDAFNHAFPTDGSFSEADIIESFAGLRVLPAGGGSTANSRSRETILRVDRKHRPRVLSIYGGKLTAYRATAEKVLSRLRSSLPPRDSRLSTAAIQL